MLWSSIGGLAISSFSSNSASALTVDDRDTRVLWHVATSSIHSGFLANALRKHSQVCSKKLFLLFLVIVPLTDIG